MVDFTWHDDAKTISYCHIRGLWTWAEFYAAQSRFRREEMQHKPARIDIILQIDHDAVMPENFISTLRRQVTVASQNWQMTVVVNPSQYVRTLFNVFYRIYPEVSERYPLVADIDAAEALIEQHRSTLTND